jgi:hypothetical protein
LHIKIQNRKQNLQEESMLSHARHVESVGEGARPNDQLVVIDRVLGGRVSQDGLAQGRFPAKVHRSGSEVTMELQKKNIYNIRIYF